MAATVVFLGPLLALILLLIAIYLVVKLGRPIIELALNSLIGLIALLIINFLPFINIDINIWSVLIVAIGGIPGIILLILLDLLGIAF